MKKPILYIALILLLASCAKPSSTALDAEPFDTHPEWTPGTETFYD